MKKDSILAKKQGISFFEKNLPILVLICMALGIAIGQYFPEFAVRLEKLQILNTSIPIAVLTWIMIFPMMLKIDLKAILNVRKNYKGVVISSFTSWAVKPFLMFGLASFFLYVVFKSFIPIELAQSYVAGAVLLGAGHAQQWSSYGVRSQKGASAKVDQFGVQFVTKYTFNELNKVAKVHFVNTKRIEELLQGI